MTRASDPGRFAYWMRALGRDDLPSRLALAGRTLRRLATAKHDFWAATGFYEDDGGGRAVLKVYRTTRFAGAPLRWLGRWQYKREVALYRHLSGVACVPALLDRVSDTAYLLAFVAGHPLSSAGDVPNGFWSRLDAAMREVHHRGVAYVDSNKPENVLVGDDGHPYLIDFQIAWRCGPRADHALGRWWLARLQREDRYHVLKHKRRFARDNDDPGRADQRPSAQRLDPRRSPAQPALSHGAPAAAPVLRRTGRVLSSGSN